MEEIWKDIPDYEGLYQVSNLGRVRSLKYHMSDTVHILKPSKNTQGYYQIHLSKNGNSKIRRVHKLVCQSFIPNPDNLPQVNHKNEDKTDNRVENLEWCTAKYNSNYGTRNSRVKEARKGLHFSEEWKKKISKALSKTVFQYTKDGLLVKIYSSTREASRITGVKQASISECCRGNYKTAGGYIWKYV